MLNKQQTLHALISTILIAVSSGTPAAPMYDIVDLGGLRINDMNNLGQVVGTMYPVGSSAVAASWNNGNLTIYDEYTGFDPDSRASANALAVNDNGLVAGYVSGRESPSMPPWAYQAAKFVGDANNNEAFPVGPTGIKSPNTHQVQSQITALNDSNTGVGIATDGVNHHRAAVFDIANNSVTDICGALGIGCNWGQANDINENGLITGAFSIRPPTSSNTVFTSFAYQNGQNVFTELKPVDGAYGETPWAVNDAGAIVGSSVMTGTNQSVATLWQSGGPGTITGTAIGGIPAWVYWSEARDINNSNQVLIRATRDASTGYSQHTLLADQGSIYNLEDLINPNDPLAGQIEFQYASAINDDGWITVTSHTNGAWTGYLLKPTAAPPPPPPATPQAAQLTTGSPVSLSQFVTTGLNPLNLSFDYWFTTLTGVLTVTLGGVPLGTISAPDVLAADFLTHTFTLGSAFLSDSSQVLSFILDGPTGSTILLDNIDFPGLSNPDFQNGNLDGWDVDVSSGGAAGVVDSSAVVTSVPSPSPLMLVFLGVLGLARTMKTHRAQSN